MAVVAEFGCVFDQSKIGVARSKARGELCNLIKKHRSSVKPGKLQWILDMSTISSSNNNSSSGSGSTGSGSRSMMSRIGLGSGTNTNSFNEKLAFGDGESDIAVIISQSDSLHASGSQVPPTSAQGNGNRHGNDESNRHSHHINTASDTFDTTRSAFWKKLGVFTFALSPPGYGMDTHRLWEILHMGAVPIALHSPLDALYTQFPIVLVSSWAEVFQPGALLRFRKDILQRFPELAGGAPVNGPTYREKLEAAYWAELIATEKRKILAQ